MRSLFVFFVLFFFVCVCVFLLLFCLQYKKKIMWFVKKYYFPVVQ